ncbi:hypothetical protein PS9374_01093 [Planomonospora sphaerica]|uniref:Uncharacterized protein n=1 Tax=Planomonospora sphaerica TaxID=161355 RepID=A0A171BRC3_9ACTN|nr:hypothetical protein PS9374_01093 [Planomonospora sphaerica]
MPPYPPPCPAVARNRFRSRPPYGPAGAICTARRGGAGPEVPGGDYASVMPVRARPPADSRTAAATAPATSGWKTLGMM